MADQHRRLIQPLDQLLVVLDDRLFSLDRGFQLAFATAIAFPILGLIVRVLLLRGVRPAVAPDPLQTSTATTAGAEVSTARALPDPGLR
jgi:hypothetical protein